MGTMLDAIDDLEDVVHPWPGSGGVKMHVGAGWGDRLALPWRAPMSCVSCKSPLSPKQSASRRGFVRQATKKGRPTPPGPFCGRGCASRANHKRRALAGGRADRIVVKK